MKQHFSISIQDQILNPEGWQSEAWPAQYSFMVIRDGTLRRSGTRSLAKTVSGWLIKYKIVGALWVNWFVLINASIYPNCFNWWGDLSELRVATTVPQRTRDQHMLAQCSSGPYLSFEIFECARQYGCKQGWEALQNKMARGWFTTVEQWQTLAPTIVINWLSIRAEAGQAKPKAIATPSTKKLWMVEQDLSKTTQTSRPQYTEVSCTRGYIDLKYLDESGCCLWVPSVTAIVALERKRLETERRGRRISILGLWQPDEGFAWQFQQFKLHHSDGLGSR